MRANYILVVEDERPIREMLLFWLRRYGFDTAEAEDAEGAKRSIAQRSPDLMLVDWTLPRMSGLDLARSLKGTRATGAIPIIMVTARIEEDDRVTALDGGADDYLTKPFSARELLARINALLRRSSGKVGRQSMKSSGLMLDNARRCVTAGSRTLQLSPMDFQLLAFFMANPERVHDRSALIHHVWGGRSPRGERTVDVQISRLRQALEELRSDQFIQTVQGAGYRFSTLVN